MVNPEDDGNGKKCSFYLSKSKNFTPYKSMIFSFECGNTNGPRDGFTARIRVWSGRVNSFDSSETREFLLGEKRFDYRDNVAHTKVETVPLDYGENKQRRITIDFGNAYGYHFNIQVSKIELTV